MDCKGISTRRLNVFFNNLLALGFDVAAMSKEHKIVFDKKMFLIPNRKGMEVVAHFLLSKLNECGGQFSIIWPLMTAQDRRLFFKTAFEYLTQIAKESEIKFPPVSNSVCISCGGASFFDLYLAFSTHVVQQVNKTIGPMLRRPKSDPKFTKHAIEMLKLASLSSVEKFQALTDSTKLLLDTSFSIAEKSYDYVERLKLANSKGQSLLEENIKRATEILKGLAENSLEGLTLKHEEHQNKIEALWEKLEIFLSKEEKMWNIISSELEDSTKPILRGSAYSLTPSNNLKNCYEDKYPELQNQFSEEGNQLCIPRFLKLFTVVLEFYVDSIKRGEFLEVKKFQCLKHVSVLVKSLKMLQSSSALLEEGNEVNRNLVQTFKEKIGHVQDCMEDISKLIADLPPSPEACLESNENTPTFLFPSVKILKRKLDDNIEKVSVIDSSHFQTHRTFNENDNLFSPIRNVSSLSDELNYSDLNQFAHQGIFGQTLLPGATVNDTASNVLEVDLPDEESLNTQTLCDISSLSFLDD